MHTSMVCLLVTLAFSPCLASIISTQYHAQDGLGGYSYGHTGGPSSKQEYKTPDGRVSGSYSYVDGNGVIQTAVYSADPSNGFRVQASNLPVAPNPPPVPVQGLTNAPFYRPLGIPVVDTPEVAAAKVAHLAAVERQKQVVAAFPNRRRRGVASADRPLGVPVVDTPEVSAAKAAHLSAVELQKATIASLPYSWNNGLGYPFYSPFGFGFSYPYSAPYNTFYPYALASVHTEDVPVPVTDTPEVAAARQAHLSAVEEAKLNPNAN